MALRLWSKRATGLTHLAPACQFLCNNLSTVKASFEAHDSATFHEADSTSERKKERLSRKERTALVESFVIKHMQAHEGEFPSVSVVLKETGGGRSAVKEILHDVQSRFTQLSKQTSSIVSNSRIATDGIPEEDGVDSSASGLGVVGDPLSEMSTDAETSGTSSDDSEDSDDAEGSIEEFDPEDVGNGAIIEELEGIPEAEGKSVTFTNGQMIGSSHGEIETHSGLWSRLRKLGASQGSKPRQSSQQSPSDGDHLRQDVDQNNSTKENRAPSGSVALSFSDVTDLNIKNSAQKVGSNGRDEQEDRHGLFLRYLSPQATPADLKEAFSDCGEIIRAQAIKPRTHQKYTYGFVDFKTAEALQKALEKDKVYIKGVRIRKEPSSSTPKIPDRNGNVNPLTVDFAQSRVSDNSPGSFLGPSKSKGIRRTGYSVAVEDVPLHIPLTEVKEALSKYGEIAHSSRKEGHGGYIANVEFKGEDARKKALSAKSVQLNGMHYSILRVDPIKTSVVRLNNAGFVDNTEQIQATCELHGRVDKVISRCDGIVDVYFHPSELENMPRILSRLNEVKVEGQVWQAQPSSCMDPSSYLSLMRTRGGQEWLQQESERMLGRIESALKHLVVEVEDLQRVVKMKTEYVAS
ncbi:uncharacterized protein [Physcomitrium patens]|uniref:RRM domain-containing protein n=1 Tax=Physcomitrium patens TaxID=3218 RepID=A0A2K1KFX1_PHYPA|nr:uncharacterized protein LOC112283648 isoform X1 [Physcomitrium patens]PNR52665.1 hypothetical protein PHYPA_009039 [Physcomitrium patens]|eukprot:XP_024378442.1 uncharacterized protein LOC112283648 isoform X1 [Physcomitrella patens]